MRACCRWMTCILAVLLMAVPGATAGGGANRSLPVASVAEPVVEPEVVRTTCPPGAPTATLELRVKTPCPNDPDPDECCFNSSDCIELEVRIVDVVPPNQFITGVQFFLDWDASCATVSGIQPGFGVETIEFIDNTNGAIRYAINTFTPVVGDHLAATITVCPILPACEPDFQFVPYGPGLLPTKVGIPGSAIVYPDCLTLDPLVGDTLDLSFDLEAPVITCPPDINANTDPGECEATVDPGQATATDNVTPPGDLVITCTRSDGEDCDDPYPVGCTTLTWTACDECGNCSSCEQVICVADNELPTIDCPDDINTTSDPGKCSADVDPGWPVASDNCSYDVTWCRSDLLDLHDPYPVGCTTITWCVFDGLKTNMVCCDQKVCVADDEDPVITCPPDIEVSSGSACEASVNPGMAVCTDNCPGSTVECQRDDGKDCWNDPYLVRCTTLTWTCTDAAGNKDTCDQKVCVTDDEPPTIECPPSQTVPADTGLCSAVVDPGTATCHDNCGCTVSCTRSDNKPLTDPYPVGTTTITCTATDGGHTVSCWYTITVIDDQPPEVICPPDLWVPADSGKCWATVDPGMATCQDNCPGSTLPCVRSDGKDCWSDPYPVGMTTLTWTCADAAGNSVSCQQNITVYDNEPPHVTCPDDIITNNDLGMCGAFVSWPPPPCTDNCGSCQVSCVPASGSFFPVGTTTVTCTASDGFNTAQCQFDVIVNDNEKPDITCPPDVTTNTDPGKCEACAVNLGTPPTGDNCGVQSVTNDAPACFPVGETTVTWTVTDIHGNTSTCTQKVKVEDKEKPTITCPPDKTVPADPGQCSAIVDPGMAVCTDNCPGSTTTCERSDGKDCWNDPYPVGCTTLTWTCTDAALPVGNKDTCDQKVCVTDAEPPVFVWCPDDLVRCNDLHTCGAEVVWEPCTCTDNCGSCEVICDYPSGYFFPVGTTTVTCTASDASGNTSLHRFDVIVNDCEYPQVTCPPNITTNADPGLCSAIVNTGQATCWDNCPCDHCGARPVRSDNPALGIHDPFPVGCTRIKWICADAHGHAVACVQWICVRDAEPPTVTCPPDKTVPADPGQCSAVVDPGMATCHDNCSCEVSCSRSDLLDCSTDEYPVGTTILTWTAKDKAGNTASCEQKIIVVDTEPPVPTCPADITTCNDLNTCGAIVSWDPPTCSDNCGSCTVTCDHSSGSFFPVGTTTVTCTASDGFNTTPCQFDVTVNDCEDPAITCPPDKEAVAPLGACEATVDPGTATCTDNCGECTIACSRSDGKDCITDPYPVGCTTVTWRATDPAGNTSQCDQQVCVKSGFYASIELRGGAEGFFLDAVPPFVRPITFELFVCGSAPVMVCQDIVFSPADGKAMNVFVEVPTALFTCPACFTCITARDKLHSLRRTLDGIPCGVVVSVEFLGDDKELRLGNLNDDCFVDVEDFGIFLGYWPPDYPIGPAGCGTAAPHSDFNGDQMVTMFDSLPIYEEFFGIADMNCCGFDVDGNPMTAWSLCDPNAVPKLAISVKELGEKGVRDATRADLDNNGVVDLKDVAAFMLGARPGEPMSATISSEKVQEVEAELKAKLQR